MNHPSPRIYAKAGGPAVEAGQRWYTIQAAATDSPTAPIEVALYDDIGAWGIRAADFIRDLKAVDDGTRDIVVGINSLGGDVFDGIAIHNALRRLGNRVTARIDGVAASIASVIAVGAHRVVMPDNTMMMIHNPWTITFGEADDLRQTADMMDKVRDTLVACYRAKAPGLEESELVAMLGATTWLTAAEAAAHGLADEVAATVSIKASAAMCAGLGRLKNAPPALLAELQPPEETPPPANTPPDDPQNNPPDPAPSASAATLAALACRLCAAAGVAELAEIVVSNSHLADEPAVRAQVDRVVAIRDLCVVAKHPEMAGDLVRAGLDVNAVRARLFDKIVASDIGDVDGSLPSPQAMPTASSKLKPSSIYAARQTKPAAPIRRT